MKIKKKNTLKSVPKTSYGTPKTMSGCLSDTHTTFVLKNSICALFLSVFFLVSILGSDKNF